MSLTTEFLNDVPGFLKKYVVLVPAALDNAVQIPAIRYFEFEAGLKNTVQLALSIEGGDAFPAYYLPWQSSIATTTDLDKDADFFFTSQMTNCRFSILDVADPKKPKVAHVAGNESTPKTRDDMEVRSGFVARKDLKLARRFSISQSIEKPERKIFGGKTLEAVKKLHDYRGTSVKEKERSSAFVYGVRTDLAGWKFFAQIVMGDMSQTVTDDVTILSHAHLI